MAKHTNGQKPLHRIIAQVIQYVLSYFDLHALFEVPIGKEPPRIDLIIMRKRGRTWSDQQRVHLPDGIRDSTAHRILIELKYTESLTERAANIASYQRSHRLHHSSLASFLLSARTPQRRTRERLGYTIQQAPGLYRRENPLLEHVTLIVLSELSNAPHNALFKLFAHSPQVKIAALNTLHSTRSY